MCPVKILSIEEGWLPGCAGASCAMAATRRLVLLATLVASCAGLASPVRWYDYRIVQTLAHRPSAFTQGLFWLEGTAAFDKPLLLSGSLTLLRRNKTNTRDGRRTTYKRTCVNPNKKTINK